ncbi:MULTISPECIES: TlpA family protein disulfide reductase [Shewanella]|uniref:TlpA family protein disulfide reductase n=1 Tax=Shewanella TaxID=22 RepID=UPI001BB9CEF3|nr:MULTISPECIES: TlpA disulfide reductase family protein [Shewanella]GIU02636.1 alkyl hydroperoxide reductase [Shewanella sp. KT0246]
MNIMIKAIMLSALAVTITVNAYPGMEKQQQHVSNSTLDKINVLENPFPIAHIGFNDAEGKEVDFDEHKGKVVIVNMWATWCPPCVRELPALDRLEKTLSKDDFVLMPISIDAEGKKQVSPFLESIGLPSFNSYYDARQNLREVFPLDTIPATFILNKEGELVAYVRTYVDWDDENAIEFLQQFQ